MASDSKPDVGFVGLGHMGGNMAALIALIAVPKSAAMQPSSSWAGANPEQLGRANRSIARLGVLPGITEGDDRLECSDRFGNSRPRALLEPPDQVSSNSTERMFRTPASLGKSLAIRNT